MTLHFLEVLNLYWWRICICFQSHDVARKLFLQFLILYKSYKSKFAQESNCQCKQSTVNRGHIFLTLLLLQSRSVLWSMLADFCMLKYVWSLKSQNFYLNRLKFLKYQPCIRHKLYHNKKTTVPIFRQE